MNSFPSVAQVRQIPAVVTHVVTGEQIDENGHLNVRHYYDLAENALSAAFATWGLGPDYPERTGHGIVTAEQHLTFRDEVLPADRISMHVRVADRSDKAMHLLAFMVNDSRESLAQVTESLCVHISQDSRRACAMPAPVAEALDTMIERSRALDWEPPRRGPVGLRR